MRECEQLSAAIERFTDLLAQQGVNAPPEMPGFPPPDLNNADRDFQAIDILSSPLLFSREALGDYHSSEDKGIPAPSTTSGREDTAAVFRSGRSARVCELDEAAAGMEFVLK
jgi:hypothetical protein